MNFAPTADCPIHYSTAAWAPGCSPLVPRGCLFRQFFHVIIIDRRDVERNKLGKKTRPPTTAMPRGTPGLRTPAPMPRAMGKKRPQGGHGGHHMIGRKRTWQPRVMASTGDMAGLWRWALKGKSRAS